MKYREEVEQLTLGEEGKRRVSAAVAQRPERPRSPRLFRRVLAAVLSLVLVVSIVVPSAYFSLKGSGRADGGTGSLDSPSRGDVNPNAPDSPDGPAISDGPDDPNSPDDGETSSGGEGDPGMSEGELPSGSFYTMKEAYDNGWITKEDIMEVCYRRFGSVYEYSAENPEASVEVDYTSPYSDPVLDKNTEKAIIHAYYVETNGQAHEISESEYTLTFYGEFHGSYIVLMRCSMADDDCAIWEENIADIVWSHSGYANDFIVFRFDK